MHRTGIALAAIIALLGLLNLFSGREDASRNAAELVIVAPVVYVAFSLITLALSWIVLRLGRRKSSD